MQAYTLIRYSDHDQALQFTRKQLRLRDIPLNAPLLRSLIFCHRPRAYCQDCMQLRVQNLKPDALYQWARLVDQRPDRLHMAWGPKSSRRVSPGGITGRPSAACSSISAEGLVQKLENAQPYYMYLLVY